MTELDEIREKIKALGNDVKSICEIVDKWQYFYGLRICPRNVYGEGLALKICTFRQIDKHSHCRRRFATCFKVYFKEKLKQEAKK